MPQIALYGSTVILFLTYMVFMRKIGARGFVPVVGPAMLIVLGMVFLQEANSLQQERGQRFDVTVESPLNTEYDNAPMEDSQTVAWKNGELDLDDAPMTNEYYSTFTMRDVTSITPDQSRGLVLTAVSEGQPIAVFLNWKDVGPITIEPAD